MLCVILFVTSIIGLPTLIIRTGNYYTHTSREIEWLRATINN